MQADALDPDYEFHLDPFGQEPGLWNLYTQLTFCYALDESSSQSKIIIVLTDGLKRLTEGFPWVAGQVVKASRPGLSSEYYSIRPLDSTPRMIVRDLSSDLPTFEQYRASGFPMKWLEEELIAPQMTKPGSASGGSDPKMVFCLQATFITGGLLLTFATQHGTMDIVGMGEMIRLYSKACTGVPFTAEELGLGDRDRRFLVPLLTNESDVHLEQNPWETARSTQPAGPGATVWTSYGFSADSLQTLKTIATAGIPSTEEIGFVSTDDALSAFIWQCITHARLPRVDRSDRTIFARTVDVRRYLENVPATYPGNLASRTFHSHSFEDLLRQPLGSIAAEMRRAVNPATSTIVHQARTQATAIMNRGSRSPGVETKTQTQTQTTKSNRDLTRDITFSSWAKIDYCHDLDFHLGLGAPEAVRRPAFGVSSTTNNNSMNSQQQQPMEGVVYLLPKHPRTKEIIVALSLREEDVHRLDQDGEEWNRYARRIG